MRTNIGEIRAASALIAIAVAYMALVLASGGVPLESFLALIEVYAKSLSALALVAGIVVLLGVCAVKALRERRAPPPFPIIRDFVHVHWQRDRMLSVAAPILVAIMTITSFNAFKQQILPYAAFRFDPLFADWDHVLFLGNEPWVVTHNLFGSQAATRFIDSAYHGWFVPMTLGIILCAFLKDRAKLRVQYMLSYALSWIVIGTILAFLLPAAGPCYYGTFVESAGRFAPLMTRLGEIDAVLRANGEAGLSALLNQKYLLIQFRADGLAVGGGISAMPSMHNAFAVLFALGARRLSKTFGMLMWIYAILIWIGSIHLGWHYAIDGVVAAVLTVAIWGISGHLAIMMLYGHARMTDSANVPVRGASAGPVPG